MPCYYEDIDKKTMEQIVRWLDRRTSGRLVFDEPKQWEIREINEIMNQCISGWRYFQNPRMFSEYGRQKLITR